MADSQHDPYQFSAEDPNDRRSQAELVALPESCHRVSGVEEQLGIEVITRRHLEYDLTLPRDAQRWSKSPARVRCF